MMIPLLKILSKFYYLNPRWLYLAVTIVLLIPLVITIKNPPTAGSRGPCGLYDMVTACPTNKVILIDSSWDQGSKPECMAILECFVNDLCKRDIKFIVLGITVYAPTFAMEVIQPIADKAGYEYGKDWVHLGFIQPPANNMGLLIQSLCQDVHETRPVDVNNTPINDAAELPLMQQVRSSTNIHMVMAINYCPHLDWISFGKAQFGLPIAFGSAAIMAPYYYVYVDSGQLCGLLTGNRGASEYEELTHIYGMGSKVMMSFAFGLSFIIVAVLLGNVGFWAARRLRSME
jgi:hypothetical protein